MKNYWACVGQPVLLQNQSKKLSLSPLYNSLTMPLSFMKVFRYSGRPLWSLTGRTLEGQKTKTHYLRSLVGEDLEAEVTGSVCQSYV